MNGFVLTTFLILFLGGIGLFVFEKYFPADGKERDPGNPFGVTSSNPRLIAYIVCAILGFIALIYELITVYSR